MVELNGHGQKAMTKAMQAVPDSRQLYIKLSTIEFGFGPGVEHSIGPYHVRLPATEKNPKGKILLDGVLALLLLNEVIHPYSVEHLENFPEAAKHLTGFAVFCNDTFVYASADSVVLKHNQIEELFEYWEKDFVHGTQVWCAIQNREVPLDVWVRRIRDKGIWDIDAIIAEHQLRPNAFEALSRLRVGREYDLYTKWAKANNEPVIERSGKWRDEWHRFVIENKGWYNEEQQALAEQDRDKWLSENGYN